MNPAQPPPGTRLCALDDIAEPGSKGFLFREGEALFLGFIVRRGGEVVGYVDRCPHAGMPLAMVENRYLTREGDLILCASHGALFRVDDGISVGGPCAGRGLTRWPVKIEAGQIVTG